MRTKGIIVSSEQVATFTDFETRYLTLTLDQKTIVLLMAFMGNTPTRTRLVNCLRRLDLNNSAGRRYTSKEIGTIWTRLSAAGLLTHENKLKLPHIYAAHFRAGAEKRLVDLGSVAAREFEANSPQHSLQQFRLAMFTHDLDMVRKLYRVCRSSGFWPVKEAQSCMPPSHWEKFAPNLLRELDFFDFGELLQEWSPSPELFASLASDTVAHSALSAEQACLLTVYALLLGDAKLAQEIADRAAPGYSHAQAMCRFFKGDYDGAHTDFKQAYGDAMRFGVERLDIVDAAFALSTLAAGKSYSSASEKRTKRMKPLYPGFTDCTHDVSIWKATDFLNEAWQEPTDTLSPYDIRELNEMSGFHSMLVGLAILWFGEGTSDDEAKQLAEFAKSMEEVGFIWPAAEAAHVLAAITKKSKWRRKAKTLSNQLEHLPFAELRGEDTTWKLIISRLDALTSLGSESVKAEQKAKQKENRLVFVLTGNGENWTVEPRLQKTSAKGWTKGRRVALKHLHPTNWSELDYITEYDRNVCRHIDHNIVYSGWRDKYSEDVYSFDWNVALPELVGHPLVFRADSLGAPVEVVTREAALRIEGERGRIRLTMTASVKHSDAVLVEESPSRFAVIIANEKHRKIAAILGAGLDAPAKAKKAIHDVAKKLSSMITVQSDIGPVANTRKTKADPRLHLHLMPHGDGLRLAARIRPFADGAFLPPGSGGRHVQGTIKNKPVQAVRDYTAEKQRLRALEEACPALAISQIAPAEWIIPDIEDCLDILLGIDSLGDEIVTLWPEGERLSVTRACDARDLTFSISSGQVWFEAEGILHVDADHSLRLYDLLKLIESSPSRFLPLGKGRFLALTETFRRRLDDLSSFTQQRGGRVRLHPSAAVALGDLEQEIGQFDAVEAWREFRLSLQQAQDTVPDIPSTLSAELRDYQIEGYRWLVRTADWGFGACLADDMGLGKTVQALALLLRRAELGPALIVAPASVCGIWQYEARRFAPTLKLHFLDDGDRGELVKSLKPFDLLLCTYGLMQNEIALLAKIQWNTVVLDESQAIKNPATKRAKAVKKLSASFRLALSGTPIENNLDELWSLFDFLNPGLLGVLNTYRKRFGVGVNQTPEARSRLRRLIRPFMLRRTKSQVLDELPPRTEITLSVGFSPEEGALYEALRRRALEAVDEAVEAGKDARFALLAHLTKLRRACCSPSLIDPSLSVGGCKLDVFDELLGDLLGNRHKALVFSQFVDYLHIIRDHLEARGIPYQYLDGSTPTAKRLAITESFQRGDGEIFLISLRAGGLGLNLTAASYVILMDPWWNPAVEQQASDRAHRIGQRLPVTIYRLVVGGTIEEKVLQLHAGKRELADRLLEGAEQSASLSIEEIRALLTDTSDD